MTDSKDDVAVSVSKFGVEYIDSGVEVPVSVFGVKVCGVEVEDTESIGDSEVSTRSGSTGGVGTSSGAGGDTCDERVVCVGGIGSGSDC